MYFGRRSDLVFETASMNLNAAALLLLLLLLLVTSAPLS